MYKWILLAILTSLSLTTLRPLPLAGFQDGLAVRIEGLDLSQLPIIQATVTVLDPVGRPVVGLAPEAFQGSIEGQALPIPTVATATDRGLGVGVVLAFDISGSMAGEPLEQAKQAGKALVDQLGPTDRVAVLAFADSVQIVQPFTENRQALAVVIDSLVAGGNTALYEAVARSVEVAAQSGLPRRAVVLLSDGRDYGSVSGLDRPSSLTAVEAAGVPLFVAGLGNQIDQPYLEELASAARGQLMVAPAPTALSGLYETIGAILRHQYLLTFDTSALTLTGAPLLRVTVTHSGAVAAAEAPLNLPPPPPETAPPPEPVMPAPPEPPALEKGQSRVLALLLVAGAAAGIGLLAVFWWTRRRRRRRRQEPEAEGWRQPGEPAPAPPPVADLERPPQPVPHEARLQLVAPAGGQTYSLGESPLTIGFTSDCNVRLPHGATGRGEQVRLWRREGRYMLHNLSPRGSVSVAGRPVVWVVLEEGDEIQVGPCRLVFRLPSQGTAGSSAKF